MPNYGALAKNVGKFLSTNSPTILTGMAVAGVMSTAVLAVKGTPQALDIISEMKYNNGQQDLTKRQIIKGTYLCYVPAASVGLVTVAAIVAGHTISTRRNAAIMSLWTLTEQGFREYQDKVVETIGKDKEEKVRAEVMQDRIRRDPTAPNEVIIMDGENKVLMYDTISGRYFKNDMESIRRAENDINQIIVTGQNYASLNDFWSAVGLSRTEFGDSVGWTTDQMLNVLFSSVLDEETHSRPCLAIEYRTMPIQGYYASFLG